MQSSSRLRAVLTVWLSSLLIVILCEFALRMFWHNPFRSELPDHVLKLRIHHPNSDHIFSRALVNAEQPQGRLRVDSRSYILPSFQYHDPDVTVAFLGGSTTECSAVQEELRFPALVSKLLADRGYKVNTLNAARSGNTLHDSLNVLLNHVSADRPEIIILMHASNDAGVLASDGDYRSRSGMPVSWQDLGRWTLQILSTRFDIAGLLRLSLTASTIRPGDAQTDWRNEPSVGRNLPEELFRERLKAFVHLARDFSIQPLIMTQPFSEATNALTPNWADAKSQNRFNAIIRDVAKAENVPMIDLVEYLRSSVSDWNKPMEIFYDAIHVTDKGSVVYATYIADRLVPIVRMVAQEKQAGSRRRDLRASVRAKLPAREGPGLPLQYP